MIGSLRLEWPLCLRNENTCARRCRVWCCYTTWPTSTTRCRSAHLVFVQPNHLLSAIHIVLVMRTAASTAMPPWQATTELIKSKVDGNCVRPPTRRHSDSEDRRKSNRLDISSSRHLIAQCVQFFKPQSDNTKSFSWGSKGDILFCEREYPLRPVQRLWRCFLAAHVPRLTLHLSKTAQRIFQKPIDFFKVRRYT